MNEEYEEYVEAREEKRNIFSKISPLIWIVLLILLVVGYYFLKVGNAKNSDYMVIGGIVLIVLYGMSRGEAQKEGYITRETADSLVLDYLKKYKKLRKDNICKISLPRGEVELGYGELEKSPFDLMTPINWHIGFTIYDDDEDGNAKYFLAKVDPKIGGIGLTGIGSIQSQFVKVEQRVIQRVVVSGEKYGELLAKGYIQ